MDLNQEVHKSRLRVLVLPRKTKARKRLTFPGGTRAHGQRIQDLLVHRKIPDDGKVLLTLSGRRTRKRCLQKSLIIVDVGATCSLWAKLNSSDTRVPTGNRFANPQFSLLQSTITRHHKNYEIRTNFILTHIRFL